MTTFTWLAIAETIWVVGLCVWIVLERRSPTATLAWIFGLAWIPVLGIAVYLLVGPRRLRRKRVRYRTARSHLAHTSRAMRSAAEDDQAGPPNEARRQLVALLNRAGQGPPLRAGRVELLPTGDCCFAAIHRAIENAQHHVHLEYYIWDPDGTGTRLRDLLCEKARQGIQVRVLVDAIGSARLGRRFVRPLREAGADFAWFNPISLARFRPDLMNFRTHRKIVVCDGRVGFTGGINVCDDHHLSVRGPNAWRDTHVRIEGAPVGELQLAFLEDWLFAAGKVPSHPAYFPPERSLDRGPWVQILSSGPDHDTYAIEKFVFASIAGASRRVLITTPYFVPNESLLTALVTAAMRGVEVDLLVPKRGDSWLVTVAARSYFEELVRIGVRIHEYGPPMLHAKTLVVDRDLALIGTANMDNRSFRLNFEIAAAFYDEGIAEQLAETFVEDCRHARQYRLRDAQRAPLFQRIGEGTARLMSPLL